MQITAAMLINVIAARRATCSRTCATLVFDNHEPWTRQLELARRALGIYRTLRAAGVVHAGDRRRRHPPHRRPAAELRAQPAAVAVRARRVRAARPRRPSRRTVYALDMISACSSRRSTTRARCCSQQQFMARGEAVAAMKADGIEYDERMELLEEVTWPKPLDELLEQAFETFASSQPWVRDFELSPKSVVRDLYERAMTFAEYVAFYQLGRSEGLVLRYLSRRLPGRAADDPGRGEDRRAARPHRVARRAGAAGRLEPARRVGGADATRSARPGRRRRAAGRRRRVAHEPPRVPACWCATSCAGGCSSRRCSATTSWSRWIRTAAGREALDAYFDEHDSRHGPRRRVRR